jgi:hypothetical protein
MTLGRDFEVPLALAERVTNLYDEALEHYGDLDGELLAARLVAQRAGIEFTHDTSQDRFRPITAPSPGLSWSTARNRLVDAGSDPEQDDSERC